MLRSVAPSGFRWSTANTLDEIHRFGAALEEIDG